MRRRPHPDLLLSLAAVTAVAILMGLGHLLEPPLTRLADAQEGNRIAVEARVVDARGRWAMLSDGHERLGAFVPTHVSIAKGDIVRGEGVVSRANDGLVLSLDKLRVVVPVASVIRSPADLANAPLEFDGGLVVVAGYVREGMLVGGGARVALRGEGAPKEGDLLVTGTFRYHATDATYVIWVASWTPRS